MTVDGRPFVAFVAEWMLAQPKGGEIDNATAYAKFPQHDKAEVRAALGTLRKFHLIGARVQEGQPMYSWIGPRDPVSVGRTLTCHIYEVEQAPPLPIVQRVVAPKPEPQPSPFEGATTSRQKVLSTLIVGDARGMTIAELVHSTGLSQPTINIALKALRGDGKALRVDTCWPRRYLPGPKVVVPRVEPAAGTPAPVELPPPRVETRIPDSSIPGGVLVVQNEPLPNWCGFLREATAAQSAASTRLEQERRAVGATAALLLDALLAGHLTIEHVRAEYTRMQARVAEAVAADSLAAVFFATALKGTKEAPHAA